MKNSPPVVPDHVVDLFSNLGSIKAETFLTCMLESIESINLEFQGVFSRNYYNDIFYIDQEKILDKFQLNVKLSRDSVFHILPEGLFFRENILRKAAKEKNLEKFKALDEQIIHEKKKILSFFYPFDKTYFGLRFELERTLNELASNRTQIWIDHLLNIYGISDVKNNLIRRTLSLLPLASEIRSNRTIWKSILQSLFFPARVDVRCVAKKETRIVKTTIHIEKLSNDEYRSIQKDVDAFARFFYEWFIPVDMGYEFKVKDVKERFTLGKDLTLDYNTQLKTTI